MTPGEARRKAIRTRYRNMVRSGAWSYNDRHDAYYETKTRKWVEAKCKDRACEFCVGRPDKAPNPARPRARGKA